MPPDDRLVRPLALGRLRLPTNLVLAPMHGHTHRALRLLARRAGAALAHTEMLAPEEVLHGARKAAGALEPAPEDRPLAVQFLPRGPGALAEAVAQVALRGAADAVDLNFACPSGRALRSGRGGAMLRRPDDAARLVEAAAHAGPLPVTIKVRLGWTGAPKDRASALVLARQAAEAGAAAVTLHARSVVQGYHGRADWAAIADWAADLKVPVLGSGDLRSPEAVLAMLRRTRCAGAAIARGALGTPWIFRQVLDLEACGRYGPVGMRERRRALLDHFDDLRREVGEEAALRLMRRMGGYYVRGLPRAAAARAAFQAARTVEAFRAAVEAASGPPL
jgi:nifR3 family TIM-barrel protein